MFCPKCGSEYRPEIQTCPQCACGLAATPPESEEEKYLRLKSLSKNGRAVFIAKAGIRDASRMAESLQRNGIAAVLSSDSCGPAGCSRGCCGGPQVYVAVLPEEVPAAVDILRQAHRNLVAGMEDGSLEALDAEVNLDADGEKSCPACGAAFTGSPEECPDCGLYLGAV